MGDIGQSDPDRSNYVAEFTDWVRTHLQSRDTQALVDYRRRAPHAARAHPSEEHFLPLLVALGASEDADELNVIEGGVTYGVLSMESYAFEIRESEARLGPGAAV
jgi:4,5-DOPA dioxygenase extradiol